MSRLYFLYAVTIFVSSFLLFQVQPLLGKHILPWFGGSPSVWITALFFFMGGLAVGYTYALLLTLLSRPNQILVHSVFLVLVLFTLYQSSLIWSSAITPSIGVIAGSSDPAWSVFHVLAVSVGLPFVLLSSTSSLLQYWYGKATKNEPFSLYAVSNTGSLLGLLSYPIVFERLLSTDAQGYWWAIGFVVYAVLLVGLMIYHLQKYSAQKEISLNKQKSTMPTVWRFLTWLLLASVPIMAMVTGTDYITGYVVAVPFLWIVPLALYLLSFIVSFRGQNRLPEKYIYFMMIFSSLLATSTVSTSIPLPVIPTVVLLFLAMFSVNHLCHEWLYSLRPEKEHLTAFYVALSFGGIFASSIVLLSSLYLVPIPVEFIFIIGISGLISGFILLKQFSVFLKHIHRLSTSTLVFTLLAIVISLFNIVGRHTSDVIASERNFFGYKAVTETKMSTGEIRRSLIHGVTNHGYQFLDSDFTHEPVGYYSETSGVSMGFEYLRAKKSDGLRVAVAGLGAGALAGHCQEEDVFDFYEIDPQVISLAEEYFTYLEECSGHSIILGDARTELAKVAKKANRPVYDYIILDAYADDVMPIHLMTTEAVHEYLSILEPDGVLAIHISSRYLNLMPVIQKLAMDNDVKAMSRLDKKFEPSVNVGSHWTLLAEGWIFEGEFFEGFEIISESRLRLWTDRYSSLLPLVMW